MLLVFSCTCCVDHFSATTTLYLATRMGSKHFESLNWSCNDLGHSQSSMTSDQCDQFRWILTVKLSRYPTYQCFTCILYCQDPVAISFALTVNPTNNSQFVSQHSPCDHSLSYLPDIQATQDSPAFCMPDTCLHQLSNLPVTCSQISFHLLPVVLENPSHYPRSDSRTFRTACVISFAMEGANVEVGNDRGAGQTNLPVPQPVYNRDIKMSNFNPRGSLTRTEEIGRGGKKNYSPGLGTSGSPKLKTRSTPLTSMGWASKNHQIGSSFQTPHQLRQCLYKTR